MGVKIDPHFFAVIQTGGRARLLRAYAARRNAGAGIRTCDRGGRSSAAYPVGLPPLCAAGSGSGEETVAEIFCTFWGRLFAKTQKKLAFFAIFLHQKVGSILTPTF